MKKLFLLFFVLFSNTLLPQNSEWEWNRPLPQGNNLNGVKFVNNDIVYITGLNGKLLKSTNSGKTFKIIKTGITYYYSSNFIDENNIYLLEKMQS